MGARPSQFADRSEAVETAVVESTQPITRQWSNQQKDIFDWFHNSGDQLKDDPLSAVGGSNLVVRARAGTGKTTTIIEGVNRAPEDAILVCAFNKKIAEELNARINNPGIDVKTLHSLGYAMIRRQWRNMPVSKPNERADRLAEVAVKPFEKEHGEKVPRQILKLIALLHTKAREMCPLNPTQEDLTGLAFRFDYVPDDGFCIYNKRNPEKPERIALDLDFVVLHALAAMHEAETVAPSPAVGIDFADMIYLPLAWKLTARDYQLVVVDEAQDMTLAQLEIATRSCNGRICVVGDDKQCQPAGTLVRKSESGNVPIESLKVGDTIESFDRHGQVFIKSGHVNAIKARPYSGELIRVQTENTSSRCTPNHKWLVRWNNKNEHSWITYLMRQGSRWRVGQCQLFRQGSKVFGLAERARVERADAAWILEVHSSKELALAAEAILSTEYGLPQMVFNPPSNIKFFTQEVIDTVYDSLDTGKQRRRALKCLSDYGRDEDYPIYEHAQMWIRRGRTTLFETQACNLLSGFMSVPIAPSTISGHNKKDRHAVLWVPVEVGRESFTGTVYSLDIERYHKYVADGIVTCNSIYGFRGADSGALDRLKRELSAAELPLTVTYRCGRNIVQNAQRLVSDIVAHETNPDGQVVEDGYEQMISNVQPGDFVLSRLNAPLVSVTLQLLRRGVRAKMAGRDIGAGLLKVLKKLKCFDSTPIEDLCKRVEDWERKTVAKLAAYNQPDQIARIHDQAETLYALAEDCESTKDLLANCERLFTDDQESGQVSCSSVHKAKGLETQRVWVLMESLYRRGVSEEERNIEYVAVTRAKTDLRLVYGVPSLAGTKRASGI